VHFHCICLQGKVAANVRWEEGTLVAELTRAEDGSTAVMRRSLIDPDTMKVTTGVGQVCSYASLGGSYSLCILRGDGRRP
jgi:hypothetical protein